MNRSAALDLLQLSLNSTLTSVRAVLAGDRNQSAILRRNSEQTRAALQVLRETGSFVRPMSIAESDAKRAALQSIAERAGTGQVSGTNQDAGRDPARTTSAGLPTAVCGLQYDADVCALPLGHEGECCDDEGNGIEVPF
jgi:hypothetical protein